MKLREPQCTIKEMKKYYLHDSQNQLGPFDIDELKIRNIKADTPVWFDSLPNWTPAGNIEELKFLFISVPPPFKTATPPPIPQTTTEEKNLLKNRSKSIRYKIYLFFIGGVLIFVLAFFYYKSKSSLQQNHELSSQLSIVQQQLQDKADEQNKQEQEKQQRLAAATARNMEYRNNWYNYISVDISSFKALTFGGFDDIIIKAKNDSEFPIDIIVAEVTYFKENGDIYKTEEVSITDIAAKDFLFLNAPGSSRGTRLAIDIVKITARKFNFCYDRNLMLGKYDDRNPKDPWKCGQ